MNCRDVVSAMVIAGMAMTAAGCRGAASGERYMRMQVSKEALRTIGTLELKAAETPKEGEKTGAPAAEAPAAEMRLSLEECRASALENNLDLKATLIDPTIASESITQEEAQFEGLFFANAFHMTTDQPTSSQLEGSTSQSTTADVGLSIPLKTGAEVTLDLPVNRLATNNTFSTLNPAYTADFSASITQPLLQGAGFRANTYGIQLARFQNAITEAQTKLQVITTIAAVDRVYWRLYSARRDLEVRRNEYDLAVAQMEKAKRMVAAGTASEVEVIRAETGVAERTEAIIFAENTVKQAQRDLKLAINRPDLPVEGSTKIVASTEPTPVEYTLESGPLVKAALENRMEMLELELQIAEDASTIDFQKNQTLPALALGYTYSANGLGNGMSDAFEVLGNKNFEDHAVSLQLSIPLGNALARSRLRQAIYSRIQRLATKELRALEIRREVLNAIDQLTTNWQRVIANRQRTALAERNLEAETRQFELGLRTSTDVFDAQTRLGNAQSAEISSLVDYQIAQIDLAYATGTLAGAAKIRWTPTLPKDLTAAR